MSVSDYDLTRDPLFYITVAFFALLTTALPGALGQHRFMPAAQALGLAVFTAIAVRRERTRRAILIVALWLAAQAFTMGLVTYMAPIQAQKAVGNGFEYRAAYLQWLYTGDDLPGGVAGDPLGRLGEIAGVILGSLFSGGLVGAWFLARATNLYGFGVASVVAGMASPMGLVAGLAPWSLLRLAGYAGLFVLLCEPILNNRWSPGSYVNHRRYLLAGALGLLVAGLVLELTLPGIWSVVFRPDIILKSI